MFKPREARHTVLIRARMRAIGPPSDVCVRNVSTKGMLLQARMAPPPGTYVEVLLPEFSVVGRVVWANERRFGIAARERIPLSRLIRASASEPASAARPQRARRAAAMRVDARDSGRAMQFAFLLVAAGAAALVAAMAAFTTLSRLSAQIGSHL